jgi:F-type H+-transporting ATPase subunit delta
MTSPATAAPIDPIDRTLLADDQLEVVRRYADALVSAAVKEGSAESTLDDLDAIENEIFKSYPRFARVLASSQVSTEQKDRILVDVFGDRVSSLVLRFLRVLNRHGRLGLATAAGREARRIWDRRHKRVPVYVRVAVALDESQQAQLSKQVSRMISATPVLHMTTDPSLIGGLVVQVGDQVYDASVSNRLEKLRQRLMEGKTHEIQSRRDQFSHPA